MPLRLSTGLRDKIVGAKTNIVSNGTFDTNTTGWTAVGATLSAAAGGSSGTTGLMIANSGAASGSAYQDLTTVAGRVYKVNLIGSVINASGFQVKAGTTADDDANMLSAVFTDATLSAKELVFIATATTTRLTLVNTSTVSGQTVLFDDVVCEELLDGVAEIMRNCRINVYTGSQPASANNAATGTLLYMITRNNDGVTGLEWTSASNGTIAKPAQQTWAGTGVANGTAGWFRVFEEGDNPASSSTTMARFDGAVATSGGEMTVTSTTVATGAVQTVSSFTYTQPAG